MVRTVLEASRRPVPLLLVVVNPCRELGASTTHLQQIPVFSRLATLWQHRQLHRRDYTHLIPTCPPAHLSPVQPPIPIPTHMPQGQYHPPPLVLLLLLLLLRR